MHTRACNRALLCLFSVSYLAFLSACSRDEEVRPRTEPQRETPRVLTVAAITDFHGALLPVRAQSADGKTVEAGGAANLSAHVSRLRESVHGPLLLLDGGDLFQGTMESNLFEGSPVVRVYNHLGVAAAALGNHEFDFGPAGEKAVPREEGDDPRGALKERVREAAFPILAANVREEGRQPGWVQPSVMREVGGVKVGIIGAATLKTPSTTNRLNLGGLEFLDPAPEITREAARLRALGAEAVVLTMHEGAGCDDNRLEKQDDLSSCTIRDVFELVERLPEGTVQVVVAGHTHRGVAKRIKDTVILQAYSSGQYLAWAEVDLGGARPPQAAGLAEVCGKTLEYQEGPHTLRTCDTYRVKRLKGELAEPSFLGRPIFPDAAAQALIAPELNEVKEKKESPLGVEAASAITGAYGDESALGNLVADATRFTRDGAELGLANGGGLRAPLPSGPLRYGDLFAVLPFDNQLAEMSVSGEELLRMIALGISGRQGALLWSGLSFHAVGCEVKEASVGGEPVTPVRMYRVATSDYLAQGGSGLSAIGVPESRVTVLWDRPFVLRDQVAAQLPRWPVLRKEEFFDPGAPRQKREGRCQ